ncbi:MAG: formylglycine-generating enzyme family protein, partial [Bacteriovoracaceae bacterium]|nr:formylglycine-generating enzyme family protein [Bacteriovoracaceae bacterium]
ASIREVDVDLEVIEDSLYRVRPPVRACAKGDINYIQLANYTNYGAVLINQYLFNNPGLPEVDKAALIFHEVIYAYLRDRYADTDSVRTREIVGYIFSDLKNVEVSEKIEEALGHVRGTASGMEFVTIPAGSFMMGSPGYERGRHSDEEQRRVRITYDYEMMTTEVTQAMYFEVMGKNPSRFKEKEHCPQSFESRISHTTGKYETLCPNNPVEQVLFNDVQNYISQLNAKTGMNYRLPTEAEWEYAARAGTQTAYSFGDNALFLGEYAIYWGNSGQRSHPVGPMRNYANSPNGNGLYDMHGNVSEYTLDWYAESLSGGVDPVGLSYGAYRTLRGGSWALDARYLRSAERWKYTPSYGSTAVGFRLVRTLH